MRDSRARGATRSFARRVNLPQGADTISAFQNTQITLYPTPSRLTKGRFAIVTDARRDAVDASGAFDESALLADGEVVWF
jgi:hypothetical protein